MMQHFLLPLLGCLCVCAAAAQEWSPAIRSTQKEGVYFWQKNLPPIFLRDKIQDTSLGYGLYGSDTNALLARWNFRDSAGNLAGHVLADFDGNGFTDCIAYDRMYLNAATSQELKYPIPYIGRPVGIADVDGDGIVDVLDDHGIYFSDGTRPLTRVKYFKYIDQTIRGNYKIYHMDTLGGKILFMTSWRTPKFPPYTSNVTIAIEMLEPGTLQAAGDTVTLRTLHSFTYPSSAPSLQDVFMFTYDDVWYVLGLSAESGESCLAVTADTMFYVNPDESFRRWNGQPVAVNAIENSPYAHGSFATVVDGRRPFLSRWYEGSDSTHTLRYVTIQSHNPPLRVRTLGVLNLKNGGDKRTEIAQYALLVTDIDGDGLQDICNRTPVTVGSSVYTANIYLTGGHVVSSAIAQTDPMSLPLARKTTGGWLVQGTNGCVKEASGSQCRVYTTDGRLAATITVQPRENGVFIGRTPSLSIQGVMIAVVGSCVVRLQ